MSLYHGNDWILKHVNFQMHYVTGCGQIIAVDCILVLCPSIT